MLFIIKVSDWVSRIGSKEEIESAKEVVSMSFELATKFITKDETLKARKENLLSTNELKEYNVIKAKKSLIMQS